MPDASTPTEPEREAPSAQQTAADEAPPSEAIVADASAPVGDPAAVEQPSGPEEQGGTPEERPTAPEPTIPDAPVEAPAAVEPATPASPAPELATPASEGDATPASAAEPATPAPDGDPTPAPAAERQQRPRRRRPRGRARAGRRAAGAPTAARGTRRERGPLPFGELRDAASAVVELFGARRALRDAFSVLGDKERADLARLVAEDGDWRARARNISAGSLGAGRVGKALAAQQVSMARVEDLWALTLSKEEAAERQSRVRNARRRDERRAQRDSDRERSSDRVSRADLAKARDGRVGATIRIVMPGEPGGGRRRRDDDEGTDGGSDVLDRLGY